MKEMAKKNKQKGKAPAAAAATIQRPSTSSDTTSSSIGCILPNFLYLAPASATGNVNLLKQVGITHIISIGKNPVTREDGITYHKFGLLDNEQADLRAAVDKVCEVLNVIFPPKQRRTDDQPGGGPEEGQVESEELLEADLDVSPAKDEPQVEGNAKVLIQCSAAISRSPAVIAGYLMKSQGMMLRESLQVLVRARDAVSPNIGFLRQLCEMEREIFRLAGDEKWSFNADGGGLKSGVKLSRLLDT
ncbi:phosphatases II [Rhypophila sp. PSN 637]